MVDWELGLPLNDWPAPENAWPMAGQDRTKSVDPSWLNAPDWYRALSLAERSALLTGYSAVPEVAATDRERARRKLDRWRAQPPFDRDAYFAQRLALDGMDEERLLTLLETPPETLCAALSSAPDWLQHLLEAFAGPMPPFADLPPGEELLSFLDLVEPLVQHACHRLWAAMAELANSHSSQPFDPETIEDILLMNLVDPLIMRLGRTLVLELNVARLRETLEGDTPEVRFRSFIEQLRRPEEALSILATYPALARQLVSCIDLWVETSVEFLRRLCADWETIRVHFSPQADPGLLVDLLGGAGDTHRGGRSVMIASFETGFQVVYKPKSLAIDVHFQELLAWLNRSGCEPPLRAMKVLDRGDYGWVEYIAHGGCETVDEAKRFYRRQGAYLALLYTLNATDFHLENLIAAGEHPILIDLETLFHPQIDSFEGDGADILAERSMADSVLQVGVLPVRLWSSDDYAGVDISGLGGAAGQLSPDRILQPSEAGTDTMRFVRERIELSGEANRPSLDGRELNARDFGEEVVAGFAATYRLLLDHRQEFLAEDGLLSRFARDEIRVLLRPTRTYGQLLFESFHPDLLHDELERDQFFDRLWLAVPERTNMAGVIGAEQADLRRGDIPIFVTHPSSLELYSASGEAIEAVLGESGLAQVRRRFGQMDERDRDRQEWFIRASLATLEAGQDAPAAPTYRLVDSATGATTERLLAAARGVADHLASVAVHSAEDVTWIGVEPEGEQDWAVMPAGLDLYAGLPGIALFLAYAGAVTGEDRYTSLARRAARGMIRQAGLIRTEMTEIGAFEGWGGLLYAFTHMGALWDDEELLAQAEQVVEEIAAVVEQDDAFDVVRGAAGAIATLLAYHRRSGSLRAVQVARQCGDHLVAAAQPMGSGIGWVIPRFGPRALTGFAHGAAGISWALLALAGATGDPHYGRTAEQALEYERSLFSEQAANWPDLRQAEPSAMETGEQTPRYMAAWCHGAAGIGLARLGAVGRLEDLRLQSEVAVALQTTLARGFGQTHCLCHGDMGNLDLLIEAEQVLGDTRWRREALRLAGMVLDSIEDAGWQCGGPPGVVIPSLMLGLAGIGYGLLRLADRPQVPSVLLLAPPPGH